MESLRHLIAGKMATFWEDVTINTGTQAGEMVGSLIRNKIHVVFERKINRSICNAIKNNLKP
jgi:hypothetical protein